MKRYILLFALAVIVGGAFRSVVQAAGLFFELNWPDTLVVECGNKNKILYFKTAPNRIHLECQR